MDAQWTLIWNSSNSNKESRRTQRKTGDGLMPDDYRARDTARVSQFQVTGKKYADDTTISINRVQRFWNRSKNKLIKRKHGSIIKTKDTELHRQDTEIGDTIRAERQSLYRPAFERMRDEFFATIDTIEIERQLLGLSICEISEAEDTGRIDSLCIYRTGTPSTDSLPIVRLHS
ncbi:hypothetical protein ACJ73_08647 [Blastomyces percursus]|uniref:Uncharacterized protein n=1 Tax=Blastomyces percursus TaxID=1658174 RepID=A0A1J9PSF4_9EURO|nr:hypothetical protein ACJ73_08647 [Blastomyces percursus]